MNRLICATLALSLMSAATGFAQEPAAGVRGDDGVVQGMLGAPPPAPGKRGPERIVARGPGIDLAYEAAQATVAACAGKHIGVAIIDQLGQPKLYFIPDGSSGDHAFTAFRKANTALLIKAPSEQIAARAASDKAIAAKVSRNPNYIVWGGGLPIIANGEVIGAIGVSGGGPEGIDKGCAEQGLKAIQDRLR